MVARGSAKTGLFGKSSFILALAKYGEGCYNQHCLRYHELEYVGVNKIRRRGTAIETKRTEQQELATSKQKEMQGCNTSKGLEMDDFFMKIEYGEFHRAI